MGFLGGACGKEPTCQCRKHNEAWVPSRVWKMPWSRAWQPTPVFFPAEFHEQRSLVGCSPITKSWIWLKWPNTYTYIFIIHIYFYLFIYCLLFSCSVMSDSLWPHGLQHARSPCPSTTPGACSNSYPLSWIRTHTHTHIYIYTIYWKLWVSSF